MFNGRKGSWEYAVDLANWSLLRRTASRRQLLEVMVDFWSNHLHVPSIHDTAWSWRNHYDGVLRHGALGKFDDLLVAASLHPAMLLFLSTDQSTKEHPDENQGRELLELHTVGVDAGYTEKMVKDSAKILTGFTVNTWRNWKFRYDPEIHWTGKVKVLDFESDNTDSDGRAVTKAYLRYLAHHPATARRLATKLAMRFVSDSPSTDLVTSVADAYLASGTSIRAALRALVAHPEFDASAGAKVRNPIEDFIATVRALGVTAKRPLQKFDWPFAEAQIWMCKGQYPFMWPRPDGLPLSNDAWSSASQVLGSLDTHYSLSGGWVGDKGVGSLPPERMVAPAAAAAVRRLRRPSLPAAVGPRVDAAPAQGCLPGDRRGSGRQDQQAARARAVAHAPPPDCHPRHPGAPDPMTNYESETAATDHTHSAGCCEEYEQAAELTRRRFVAGMAAGAGLGVASTAFGGVFRQVVFGADRQEQRGGGDQPPRRDRRAERRRAVQGAELLPLTARRSRCPRAR